MKDSEIIKTLKMENEKLQNDCELLKQALAQKIVSEIKSEAIKEFAERLKSEYDGFNEEHEIIEYPNLLKAIDCVAKEMVGE